MPLTDNIRDQAIAHYFRERDRYQKLADEVESRVRNILRFLDVRATVQSRAKTVDSFAGKLERFQQRGNKDHLVNCVDDVFQVVGDLAAVRVLPYIEADRALIVDKIVVVFENERGGRVGSAVGDIEIKPDPAGQFGKSSPNYRATHCRVFIPRNDCTGLIANLKNTACEIQVCSLLAHVWNEIEHDMGYKPQGGELSADEQKYIQQLADLTVDGDTIIAKLIKAADTRENESSRNFSDEADFIARVGEIVTLPTEPARLHELYTECINCGLLSPALVQGTLLSGDWKQEADTLIGDFNQYAEEHGSALRLAADEQLAARLCTWFRLQIIKRHPPKMRKASPCRLADVAELLGKLG